MTDLIERLRRWGNDSEFKSVLMGADEDMRLAAEEIERLRAEVAAFLRWWDNPNDDDDKEGEMFDRLRAVTSDFETPEAG